MGKNPQTRSERHAYACILTHVVRSLRDRTCWSPSRSEPTTDSRGQKVRSRSDRTTGGPQVSERDEDDLLEDEFPDAVEQRVAHRPIAAADARRHLHAGHEE